METTNSAVVFVLINFAVIVDAYLISINESNHVNCDAIGVLNCDLGLDYRRGFPKRYVAGMFNGSARV